MRNIRKKLLTIAGLASLFAVLLPVGTSAYYSNGYEVYVNGSSIGMVENEFDVATSLAEVNDELIAVYGEEAVINPDIQFREKCVTDETLLSKQELYNSLAAYSEQMVKTTMISIDGQESICVQDKDTAYESIRQVVTALGIADADNTILEIVSFYDIYVPELSVYSLEDAASYLAEQKLLTVCSSLTTMTTEAYVPAPDEYNDETLYTGVRVTTEAGIDGSVNVTTVSSYVNGELADSQEQREITDYGTPAKVAVGTKPRPAGVGTGTFSMPTSGRLSSPFGMRWGRMHNGVDLAAPIGTPIYAADEGVVISSEYKGSYGNLVIIDHQNGYKTYYAHNSENLVSVGDTITKGDLIAKMGSTGRSTGPHLHFEVRYNDQPQDPMNYIG